MPFLQPLPFDACLSQYEKQAEAFLKAHQSADVRLVSIIQEHHPAFRNQSADDIMAASFSRTDAQLTIAHRYCFEDWETLTRFATKASRKYAAIWQFESAIDAVVTGDLATLTVRLRDNPDLIGLRSMRVHQAMLLHYIGANGVEEYRQQSPANAVAIVRLLLEAGAAVDALADTYGKCTTLGLVATSVHPCRAGVQMGLIDTLLDYGAAIDGVSDRWPPLMAALANGRLEAAQALARRGAAVTNVVAAAGLGRLDLVNNFFDAAGNLLPLPPDVPLWGIPDEPTAQLEKGFLYACQFGHIDVADFLLQRGVDPNTRDTAGQTSLHCAVIGGQLDLVNWLLQRDVPLDIRNLYGGTVLGQALWCVVHSEATIDYLPIVETLLNAGARIEPDVLTWLARQDNVSSTTKAQLEALFGRFGAVA